VGKLTCNGNGNGVIESGGFDAGGELLRAWQHLSAAELIRANYTGVNDTSGSAITAFGSNLPAGSLPKTGYGWFNGYTVNNSAVADNVFYDGNYTNSLTFGEATPDSFPAAACAPPPTTCMSPAIGVILPPGALGTALNGAQAFEIDRKVDDGEPSKGEVRSFKSGALYARHFVSGTQYRTDNIYKTCPLIFMSTYQSNGAD